MEHPLLRVADVAVAVALMAAGVVLWRRARPTSVLLVSAGATWLLFQGERMCPMKTSCASAAIAAGSSASAISPARGSNMLHSPSKRPRHFLVHLRHS